MTKARNAAKSAADGQVTLLSMVAAERADLGAQRAESGSDGQFRRQE